jgi:AraC-like DNA-binding protein
MTQVPHHDSAAGINALWMLESRYTAGDAIPSHLHWYYHLFMVRDGSAELSVRGVPHTLSDGAFLFVRPGAEHGMPRVFSPSAVCYEVRIVTMTPQVENLLLDLPEVLPASPFVSGLMDEIMAENARKDSSSSGFISDYFLTLADYLHRHHGAPSRTGSTFLDVRGFSDLSRSVIRFLEDHLDKDLSLQTIADAMGYHKNYICTAFRQDTGMTLGNCLTTIRIRKAAELLSLSDMDLKQVATAVGFPNPTHFNRVFRQVTGTPPGQYRRMLSSDIVTLTKAGKPE